MSLSTKKTTNILYYPAVVTDRFV